MSSFSDTIAQWARRQELAMEAVIKESVQELAEDVVKPRARGGNMPVDTGFLRNSIAAAVNSVPSGEPEGFSQADLDLQPTVLVINNVKAGDRLVLGFTANYAKYMEAKYFFVRHSAQNWDRHVGKAVKKVIRSIR